MAKELVGLYSERESLGGGKYRQEFSVKPIAYYDGSILKRINSDWEDSGISARPHMVSASKLMVSVADDGDLRVHPTRDEDKYFEFGAPLIKVGGEWVRPGFGNRTRIGNRISWTTDYENAYLVHAGHYIKWGILLKNNFDRWSQFAIPVGLTGLTREGNVLYDDGVPVMRLRKPVVYDYDNEDDVRQIAHEFIKQGEQWYVLFTLPDLTGMSKPLIDPALELQPDAAAGKDTHIISSNPNANYGIYGYIACDSNAISKFLLQFDVSSIPGAATLTDATITLYCGNVSVDDTNFHRGLVEWYEGEQNGGTPGGGEDASVWNYYNYNGSVAWTGGAGGASGTEYAAAVSGTIITPSISTYEDVVLTSDFQDFVDGTQTNHGHWGLQDGGDSTWYRSSDWTTPAERPELVINYTLNLVTIGNGDLSLGGAVLEASDGTKIAVFVDSGSIEVWKDIDGTPALVDTDTAATVFGGGAFGWIDAAIDSNNDIHIIASCSSEQTRDVAYCVCDLTTGFGAWEQAANYTETAPTNPGCAISIDSNDYPHILFVDAVKQAGSTQDNVFYDYNDGSWNGAEQVGARAVKTDAYKMPKITVAAADDVEAFYYFSSSIKTVYRRRNAGWGTETTVHLGGVYPFSVTITTGDTAYRYDIDSIAQDNLYENNVDTTYDGNYNAINNASASLVDDSDRYYFFVDPDADIHLISNDGGGWTDEGELQEGTYLRVIAEWAYNHENQSGEINYIFDDGTNVYYDSFSLGADPEISKSESVTVTDTPTVQDIPNPNKSDSITVVDTPSVLLQPIPKAEDSITVTEDVELAGGVNPNVSDSITVTEYVEKDVVSPPAPDRDVDVNDSVTVTENAEASVQAVADIDISNISESVVVTENATIEDVPNVDVSDSTAVTEYVEAAVQPVVERSVSKSESVTVTEDVVVSVEATAIVSISGVFDSVAITENVDVSIPAVSDLDITGVSDSTVVTENVSVEDIANPEASDSITVTEDVVVSVQPTADVDISVDDSIAVTENVDVSVIAIPDLSITVDDSTTLTENVQAEDIPNIDVSDSTAVTEDAAASVQATADVDINVSDSITVTENAVASVVAVSPLDVTGISDSITVTENVDAEIPVSGDLDITGVSDSTTVSENATIEDIPNPDVSDSIGVSEFVSVSFALEIDRQESITVTESALVEDIANPDVSDSIGVSESVAVSFILEIDKQESITVTESVDVDDIANPVVSDSVTVSEYVEFSVSDSAISVQDSIGVAENVELDGIPNIDVQENIAVTENVDTYYPSLGALAVSVSDDITVTDNTSVGHIPNPITSDNVSVTENVAVDVIELTPLSANVSDNISLSDDASAEIALGIFADESISVTEYIEATVSAPQISVSDGVGTSENVDVSGIPNIGVQDSVAVTENVDAYYPELGSISVSVSDNIGVAEDVTAQVSPPAIAVFDNISVTEDVTVYVQPLPLPALGIYLSPDNVDSYSVGVKVYA